jgi:hypothetical protein
MATAQHIKTCVLTFAISHVRFTPNSDRESGLPAKVMSALPPKADICSALAHVRFGPKADILDVAEMLVCARNLGVTSFTL